MTVSHNVKLFILNNIVVESALHDVRRELGLATDETAVEQAADKLIGPYVEQFSYATAAEAERMASYYKLFFMLENDIRRFVQDALMAVEPVDWWSKLVPQAVRESAKRSRDKELNEGVTLRSNSMLEYTTFGELGEIIKQNWSVFGGVFSRASTQAVEKIMSRLNTLRGPIAHCGSLSEDEVLRLKLTVRDWFRLME
jgi:hypothetical protein